MKNTKKMRHSEGANATVGIRFLTLGYYGLPCPFGARNDGKNGRLPRRFGARNDGKDGRLPRLFGARNDGKNGRLPRRFGAPPLTQGRLGARLLQLLLLFALMFSCTLPVHAADGKVTYSGNAGSFVFEPGSEYSLSDLFPNFKDVMPGDTVTQKITVKNAADNKVKVDIYMRALGAHEDSVEFLSKLGLTVKKSDENEMAYMFDAAANETAQLTDWVCLGTLYSGGEVNLDVTLTVPVELDNMFQNKIGYLDWEFRVDEFPVEPEDPKPPQTGDSAPLGLLIGGMIVSAVMIIILLIARKKKRQ